MTQASTGQGSARSGAPELEGGAPRRGPRRLASFDDEGLLARARLGDKEAFEVFVGRHADEVLALSTRLLGDGGLGRRVAREVFLELWVRLGSTDRAGGLRAELARLALEKSREQVRRSGGGATPGRLHPLERLAEDDRQVLALRFGMHLPYDEIATVLGRPSGTIRARAFQALRTLRSAIEEARP